MQHRATAIAAIAVFFIALAGCASNPERRAVTPGVASVLQPGEAVALPRGASLRYLQVVADSRCRPDVQCVRAGDADVAFVFVPAEGAPQSLTLNTARAPAAPIGDWQLRLLALEFGEAPRATIRIDAVRH